MYYICTNSLLKTIANYVVVGNKGGGSGPKLINHLHRICEVDYEYKALFETLKTDVSQNSLLTVYDHGN